MLFVGDSGFLQFFRVVPIYFQGCNWAPENISFWTQQMKVLLVGRWFSFSNGPVIFRCIPSRSFSRGVVCCFSALMIWNNETSWESKNTPPPPKRIPPRKLAGVPYDQGLWKPWVSLKSGDFLGGFHVAARRGQAAMEEATSCGLDANELKHVKVGVGGFRIHPGKLTACCTWKSPVWKGTITFKTFIFGFKMLIFRGVQIQDRRKYEECEVLPSL